MTTNRNVGQSKAIKPSDAELERLIALSLAVQDVAEELLKSGKQSMQFICPQCKAQATIELDNCCGVVAQCETPNCLRTHINLRLDFKEHPHEMLH